jgi:hypothetical protein
MSVGVGGYDMVRVFGLAKGILILFIVVSCFFLSVDSRSFCQQTSIQYQAEIWLDKGCNASYLGGESIIVYFQIREVQVSSETGSGSTPAGLVADRSMPETPEISVTITDYYVTQGTQEVIAQEACELNELYYLPGTVKCVLGQWKLELSAEISTRSAVSRLKDECYYNVTGCLQVGEDSSGSSCEGSSGSSYGSPCFDYDNDGYTTCAGDCNDSDPNVHPGARDMCDGYDNDCDGMYDEDCSTTTMVIEVSPQSLPLEDAVYISGYIFPSRAATVNLLFVKPDGTTLTQSTNSSSEGTFSFLFVPDMLGIWYVSASSEGSRDYRAATSNSVPFSVKKQMHISVEVVPTTMQLGESVEIRGTITPSEIADIVVDISNEGGFSEKRALTTSSDGHFSYVFNPGAVGTWHVSASTQETSEYVSSTSEITSFVVKKIKTSLSINVSSSLLYPGEHLTLHGTITPAMSTSLIILIQLGEERYENEVTTSPDGTFSFSYPLNDIGNWSVSAVFEGNDNYESVSSNSVIISVTKGESVISLNVSRTEIIEQNSMEITGAIRPPRSTTVLLSLESDRGQRVNLQVVSDENGMFSQIFVPQSTGQWSVYAQIPEEKRYEEAASNVVHFTVIPAVPDLAISNFFIDPISAHPGEEIRISFEIDNLGTGSAKAIYVEVRAISGTEETTIYQTTLSDIAPGDLRIINRSWPAISGVDSIAVRIDPLNSIAETNEDNNTLSEKLDISFREDISIVKVYFSPENPREGELSKIVVQINCEGDISSCRIRLYDEKSETGQEIREFDMDVPSEGRTVLQLPWSPSSGVHLISIVADPLDNVHEFDETNNEFKTTVAVEKALPVSISEATVISISAISAGGYWYMKNNNRPIYKDGRKVPRRIHFPKKSVEPRNPPSNYVVPRRIEPPREFEKSLIYRAKDALLKAGVSTATSEVGARLYKTLYNKHHTLNGTRYADLQGIAEEKIDLLEKIIAHLFVFDGYIDTEEFCRFNSVREADVIEMLRFLCSNSYIEGVII